MQHLVAKFKQFHLSGTALKFIAVVTMTINHIGNAFFPSSMLLGGIGRLAFPLFAFLVAEGMIHTHSRMRYLLQITATAIVTFLCTYPFTHSLHMNVMFTYMMSAVGIILLEKGLKKMWGIFAFLAYVVTVFAICVVLPTVFKPSGFHIDYGIFGVALPVALYLLKKKWQRFAAMVLWTAVMIATYSYWVYLCALVSAVLVLFYDGTRGKCRKNGKYLFYIYYPLHLLIINVLKVFL